MDERRTGWLLIVLLAGQLVFLGIEGARKSPRDTYIETLMLRFLGPVARAVAASSAGIAGIGDRLDREESLRRDNHRLRRELDALKLKELRLEELERDAARLRSALPFASAYAGRIRAVDVVYADYASWQRALILYCGDRPAKRDQAVLVPEGLVGRVVAVSGPYAKVQLITDRSAAVGAMLVRTGRQGVVRGSGNDQGGLVLDYVPLQADAKPGDRVLTAGIDGVYPRGIPLGSVVSVKAGGQLFHEIQLTPAADFGTLARVFLLDADPLPAAAREKLNDAHP